MTVTCLVGAQYGSEGKGVIAHHLADQFSVHVRVGGPNAGHTFWHDGSKWVMRQIPCGWTNPKAHLVIGVGALINPSVIGHELDRLPTDVAARLSVDRHAWLIDDQDFVAQKAEAVDERYGSTMEGVGMARISRVLRKEPSFAIDHFSVLDGFRLVDTAGMLETMLQNDERVLIEGTQGFGLSLLHGHWPFTTSHDTTPAQLLADAGIAPNWLDGTILVARTFPIRVGGNSGPLQGEVSWQTLSGQIGRPVREYTTVTGRLRRIGWWDDVLFGRAVRICRPSSVALTFLDYVFPEVEGVKEWVKLSDAAKAYVEDLERRHSVNVCYIGTGGPTYSVVEAFSWNR